MAKKKSRRTPTIESNPFEPSGSGAPLREEGFWFPEKSWKQPLVERLDRLDSGTGRRAILVIGDYGSGKSYVLRWLERVEFPKRNVLPYYFENPEVKFYDLANALLRRIGRKHFAKLLYELSAHHRQRPRQRTLFERGFDAYLAGAPIKPSLSDVLDFQEAIKQAGITGDDEIANCLARVIVDTRRKPYFEFRDFVSTKSGSYAAERQEPPFFDAILKVLRIADGVERIAFLLDEFEQVALQRKLTRRDAHDYLVTLKRLLDAMEAGDLWLVLAMTRDAADKTKTLDPAFWERCYEFTIPQLSAEDAETVVTRRFSESKPKPIDVFSVFEADFIQALAPTTYASPRYLIKVFHDAVNEAMRTRKPVSNVRLSEIEQDLYPSAGDS